VLLRHNTPRCAAAAADGFLAAATAAASPALLLLLPVPQYHNRLCDYLNTFDKAFVVHADNVGSKQMSDIRAVSLPATGSPPHSSPPPPPAAVGTGQML
jgi:hypothetical protein